MNLTQWLVVTWVGSIVSAALLLLVASVVMRRITQPAHRIRLIHFTLIAALAAPLLWAMSPIQLWRWNLIPPTARTVPTSMITVTEVNNTTMANPPLIRVVERPAAEDIATVATEPPQSTAASAVKRVRSAAPLAWFEPWTFTLASLVGLHAFAAVFFLTEAVMGLRRWRHLVQGCVAADEGVLKVWNAVTNGQGHRVRLLVSTEIDTPLAFGWWHPMVLVPASVVTGPLQALRFCLAQPIKGFRTIATYAWGKQEYVVEGEQRSDINFERQDDGRQRTRQMLPDEDVTYTVAAPGYDTVTEKVRLPEGEQKDLVVTLKKKAAETKQE